MRFEERGTLFQHVGEQKGKGLDVDAEPPRRTKHFLKAVTRGTCDKRLAKGLENRRYFYCPIFQVAEYAVNHKEPFILKIKLLCLCFCFNFTSYHQLFSSY